MGHELSARQQELFDFVALYIELYGEKPMYKEMSKHMGVCTQSISELLKLVERKGWKMSNYGWIPIPEHLLEAHREREAL